MATMQDRMDDAKFSIITPQCDHCLNAVEDEKFDITKHDPIKYYGFICTKDVELTKEIRHNKVKCPYYVRNEEEVQHYEKYGMVKYH